MELIKVVWDFLVLVVLHVWWLGKAALVFVWELLVALHVTHPRLEGLLLGVTLAWLLTRRDKHPLIRALSAPLKLVLDIIDLVWDHIVDFSKDVWEATTGWLKKATAWIKGKLSSAWRWTMDRLRSVKDRLSKKDSEE